MQVSMSNQQLVIEPEIDPVMELLSDTEEEVEAEEDTNNSEWKRNKWEGKKNKTKLGVDIVSHTRKPGYVLLLVTYTSTLLTNSTVYVLKKVYV